MFEPNHQSRVFMVPIGADFSQNFVDGLFERAITKQPHEFASITIYLNTRRAARRVEDLFKQKGATLLPRLKVLSDLTHDALAPIDLALPVSPLQRRLKLADLVAALIEQQPDLAPKSSVFALADSLAALLDEFHGEGVSLDRLQDVELGNASEHWDRSLKFLNILTQYWTAQSLIDPEARQRAVIQAYTNHWVEDPPSNPIIIAGSTGSRGATALFMQAVSKLPQGAVVLPGYDVETPADVWDVLGRKNANDDHPQSMLARVCGKLNTDPNDIPAWHEKLVFSQDRNKLLSLALRPAPVTDQWLEEGPDLIPTIPSATQNISLISAVSPKDEANAIAVCLREAAERNETAVLITPDRNLTRRVSAQLNRWNITPDDSAGEPLHLSAIGIFMRLTAGLLGKVITPAELIAVLKHPLTHQADDRGNHLRFTRDLERAELDRDTPLIRGGPPFVQFDIIREWADAKHVDAQPWVAWLCDGFEMITDTTPRSMSDWLAVHEGFLYALSKGAKAEQHCLWRENEGQQAQRLFDNLAQEADGDSVWTASDYASLLYSVLQSGEVRDAVKPHPNIAIWGTLEARVQGADLVILGGLNEGIWPQKPKPDPWLNRSMRKQLGLLLPERNIGLSAHDFQQAFGQNKIVLSRAIRDGEAPTVSSRWLTRLNNLLTGLGKVGETALSDMANRGDRWLQLARSLDRPTGRLEKAARPAPVPPATAHPKRLSVTRIKTLVRNPYEIYAQSVLELRALKPYGLEPDALSRGIVLHTILETFNQSTHFEDGEYTVEHFLDIATKVLERDVPWQSARRLWFGRLKKIAPWLVEAEQERSQLGRISAQEIKGARQATEFVFTLTAKADRLDLDPKGQLMIYDYKSGDPPGPKEIHHFDKQLQLEAAIAAAGGFANMAPLSIAALQYISLKGPEASRSVPVTDTLADDTWAELIQLLRCHFENGVGYGARLKMQKDKYGSDYDHLSRFGEWEETDMPETRDVP
ncbi:double-strand break repair protein AddB [Amylibacter sp. SFDW26]|uniref:double-strand break repair protein AddB n=1 Tax=Amylibacter sp. SFDW26 TaxID=2652722 RepID=UPI001261EBED|nr:double-strand break repair protein AddB [Amylibacter sp. SFDW26]KAB7614618.1 double-strand break repair protein AddB [Amylibacter sp. SFDW26]